MVGTKILSIQLCLTTLTKTLSDSCSQTNQRSPWSHMNWLFCKLWTSISDHHSFWYASICNQFSQSSESLPWMKSLTKNHMNDTECNVSKTKKNWSRWPEKEDKRRRKRKWKNKRKKRNIWKTFITTNNHLQFSPKTWTLKRWIKTTAISLNLTRTSNLLI